MMRELAWVVKGCLRRLVMMVGWLAGAGVVAAAGTPNVIVVLCDNLGNGDVACFNPGTVHRTPHLDTMAKEGRMLTSFYSCSGVCTPSRASLMTGCYPRRVNLHESDKGRAVLQPVAKKGLNPEEETVAEVMKRAGYETMLIGKWHLGDQLEFLPTRQGFDHYFGIPYSDDMTQDKDPEVWPPLPLMRDEEVIEGPVERTMLTRRYTTAAVEFLRKDREAPFFLMLAQAMPGSTQTPYASPAFQGQSANGDWGDSVEELDASMGEILAELRALGIEDETLVVWTSDNGAPKRSPRQGSNVPYDGWGYNTSEGAMRMPCLLWWPGKVAPNSRCDALCTMMDLLPTFAGLAGVSLPSAVIDGHDMAKIWLADEPSVESPYDEGGFFYYHMDQLQAVRAGPWKLYLELPAKRTNLSGAVAAGPLRLTNVRDDVGETMDQAASEPEVVARLQGMAAAARRELGDGAVAGNGQRAAGWVETPQGRWQEGALRQ